MRVADTIKKHIFNVISKNKIVLKDKDPFIEIDGKMHLRYDSIHLKHKKNHRAEIVFCYQGEDMCIIDIPVFMGNEDLSLKDLIGFVPFDLV